MFKAKNLPSSGILHAHDIFHVCPPLCTAGWFSKTNKSTFCSHLWAKVAKSETNVLPQLFCKEFFLINFVSYDLCKWE